MRIVWRGTEESGHRSANLVIGGMGNAALTAYKVSSFGVEYRWTAISTCLGLSDGGYTGSLSEAMARAEAALMRRVLEVRRVCEEMLNDGEVVERTDRVLVPEECDAS